MSKKQILSVSEECQLIDAMSSAESLESFHAWTALTMWAITAVCLVGWIVVWFWPGENAKDAERFIYLCIWIGGGCFYLGLRSARMACGKARELSLLKSVQEKIEKAQDG